MRKIDHASGEQMTEKNKKAAEKHYLHIYTVHK
jgi:hypothetical protein